MSRACMVMLLNWMFAPCVMFWSNADWLRIASALEATFARCANIAGVDLEFATLDLGIHAEAGTRLTPRATGAAVVVGRRGS